MGENKYDVSFHTLRKISFQEDLYRVLFNLNEKTVGLVKKWNQIKAQFFFYSKINKKISISVSNASYENSYIIFVGE